MDTINQEVAARIVATIQTQKRSNKSVAELAGIPVTTFHRKISKPDAFTIPELAKVADVLHVHPTHLLPQDFAGLKETA